MARKPSKSALLIIDMLNDFDFPEGKELLRQAAPVAEQIAKLRTKAGRAECPVIFVNDNFGKWRSSWEQVYRECTRADSPGRKIAGLLKPAKDDYFVLKPKHSAFYSTTLDVLLEDLNVRRLILTGIAGNICVLFTANDAHMRDFEVVVPRDCVASNTKRDNAFALTQLREVFKMKTPLGKDVRL
jgi:nicotinamidase-related amidase